VFRLSLQEEVVQLTKIVGPKRFVRVAGCSVLVILASVGCVDSGLITSSDARSGMLRDQASASSGSGAQIERSDFPFGFLGGGDPRDNLAIFVGPLDPVAAIPIKCADPTIIVPVSPGARAQMVTVPSGAVHVTALTREANIAVWQFTGTLTSFCPLLSAPLIATGTVHYKVEISDLAEHIDAVGTVTLTSGGEARLHVTASILFAADGTLKRDVERVILTPL
jgi:hypothetical protein